MIGEVDVCEDKFNKLPFENKCNLVTEEVMIMAAERYKGLDFRIRYSRMLKKFIMNHAPLWESLFIIENYVTLHRPSYNFMEKINKQLLSLGKEIML